MGGERAIDKIYLLYERKIATERIAFGYKTRKAKTHEAYLTNMVKIVGNGN